MAKAEVKQKGFFDKAMDFIEKTDLIDKTGSKRGAALYRFNENTYRMAPKFKL